MKTKRLKTILNSFNIEKIRGFDYRYYTDYDSDYNRSHCKCDDICRCATLSVHLKSIDSNAVINEWFKNNKTCDEFLKYCIDRFLSHYIYLQDINNYNCHIGNGYYGQELDGIYLNSHIENKLYFSLAELCSLKSNNEKLFYTLENEYGYILDSLKNKTFNIKTENINNIIVSNPNYYIKCDKKKIDNYLNLFNSKDFDLPICLCLENCNKYTLVDGYHRFNAYQKINKKEIKIIYGK